MAEFCFYLARAIEILIREKTENVTILVTGKGRLCTAFIGYDHFVAAEHVILICALCSPARRGKASFG
ncbi:hypothetical protein D9M70_614900 [compost metagenome]